jgi:hypothetical protein
LYVRGTTKAALNPGELLGYIEAPGIVDQPGEVREARFAISQDLAQKPKKEFPRKDANAQSKKIQFASAMKSVENYAPSSRPEIQCD